MQPLPVSPGFTAAGTAAFEDAAVAVLDYHVIWSERMTVLRRSTCQPASAGMPARPTSKLRTNRNQSNEQQLDVGSRVALGETPPPVDRRLDPTAGRVAGDQPAHLCAAQPRHLLDVAPQQPITSIV